MTADKNRRASSRSLLQMAQVWQRLAEQYDDSTPPFSLSDALTGQPAMQRQQQIPRDDDKKKE